MADQDDLIIDMDPQSAVAAQGLQAGVSHLANNLAQQYQQGGEQIHQALQGDPMTNPQSMAALQGLGAKAASSTMGRVEGLPSEGLVGRAQNMFPTANTFEDLYKAANEALEPSHPVVQALQQVKNRKMGYADGGIVNAMQHGGANYAEGGGVLQGATNPDEIPAAQFEQMSAPQSGQQMGQIAPDEIPADKFESYAREPEGNPLEQLKAGAEAFGQGVAGPVSTAAEVALGADPEAIRGRAAAYPKTHLAGEIAGLVAPSLLTGGASGLAKFTVSGGISALERLVPEAGATLASKIGSGAAKAAIGNMLVAGSDEVSKMILQDPNQSAETAIADIGLSGALGGVLGGGLGAAEPLWQGTIGGKLSKVLADFKGRIADHLETPDPVTSITKELGDHYNNVKSAADEVYGPAGLKAQDIAKAMPEEVTPEISQHAQDTYDNVNKTVSKMMAKPEMYPPRLTMRLQNDLNQYSQALSKDDLSPGEVFNAMQDLKQQLQSYSKFDKFVKPVDEAYDFVKDSKGLAFDIRQGLEDKGIWGQAAKRQQDINKAFTNYLPALKDFEKKFTTEVSGEKVIDPGKINTYVNQLGKPNAEIKQQMLKNFLDASDKYSGVINQIHANLNMDSPIQASPLNITRATLGNKTLGMKLADAFINKGLSEAGGHSLGAATGEALGHAVGLSGGMGALIGERALGPFFASVLPAIAKPLVENHANSLGAKSAIDYGLSVASGNKLISKASKGIFKAGSEVLSENQYPTQKDRDKLDGLVKSINNNPESLFSTDNKLNHYLPQHGMALDQTSSTALNYLNNLRPGDGRNAPLDTKAIPSSTATANFNRALNIAQQPLMVLKSIKDGTITQGDITHLGNMYPSLFRGLQQKLTSEMIDQVNKGKTIPYHTRVGLSVFLAQPMDSTMSPASLMATQSAYQAQQAAQQQAAPAPKSKGGTKSSPALQKMPGMYQTAEQSREQRKNK